MTALARLGAALALTLSLAIPARAEIAIQPVVSPGGIRAWLVEAPEIPFLALELRFAGGAGLDAPDRLGAATLMAGLLEEGAGDLDARAFAAARDALAADMGFSASDDSVTVSARMLTENRDAAVALLRKALVEPRFDPDALERVREQVLSGLQSDARDPQAIAGKMFNRLAFGDHPYCLPDDGTPETVAALTRDDIVAAHRGALARDRVFVAAVGDITPAALGDLLDTLLGDLPETGAPLPDRADAALAGGLTVEPFDAPQAVIAFGQPGIARDDPDFLAAVAVNEVLGGGGLTSRLMREVRESRGLTYGIGTGLSSGAFGETLRGRVATANATVGETVAVIRAEWQRIAEAGITADELEAIKAYMKGSYALRFDGNANIARILVGMQEQGLPIDYPLIRNQRVDAITLDEANRVARALFDPERLTFVVVGRPEGLEGQ
jgi:zinc protease